jgi:hypothetical protein
VDRLYETTALIKHVKLTSDNAWAYCYIPFVEGGDLHHAIERLKKSWTIKQLDYRTQARVSLGALVACFRGGWADGIKLTNELIGKTQRDMFPRNCLIGKSQSKASDFGLSGNWSPTPESYMSPMHSKPSLGIQRTCCPSVTA